MKFEDLLDNIDRYVIYGTVALAPFVVTSMFVNAFITPKLALLTGGIAISLLIKALKVIMGGEIKFSTGSLDFPVFLIALVYLVAGYIQTPNRMEAFFLPGVASIFIVSAILYFLVNQLSHGGRAGVEKSMIVSAGLVAFVSILSGSGIFENIPQLPAFMREASFNTVGGAIGLFVFLLVILPISISYIVSSADMAKKSIYGILSVLIFVGIVIAVFNSLPGRVNSPRLTPFSDSWAVSVESIKNSPLLGVGPGNYLTAFSRFRTQEFNSTDLWQVRFSTARSFYLTIITETGILGAIAVFAVSYQAYKRMREFFLRNRKMEINSDNAREWGLYSSALLAFLVHIIFPVSLPTVTIMFVLLALISSVNDSSFDITQKGAKSRLPAYIVSIPVILLVVGWALYSWKAFGAERIYTRSIASISGNDGLTAYNLLQEAIAKNPQVDRYHNSYAQVNLALANSIASQEDISDQDRNNISQLIQQAIREGKNSVALNPNRAGNWEILASIYRTIIPLAEGADQFAIQTYSQAIALDPLNPETRISLGGIYYSLGDFESAADVFRLATLVKPDHANAHFNLASAYREAGQVERAINEMSIVLSLVASDSDDFTLARGVLDDLQNRRAVTEPADGNSSNLTSPRGQESITELEPPIELNQDAEPPIDTDFQESLDGDIENTPLPSEVEQPEN